MDFDLRKLPRHDIFFILYNAGMSGLTSYQSRVATANHEVGHVLSLAHSATGVTEPSVMYQKKTGKQELYPAQYDKDELIRKWGP